MVSSAVEGTDYGILGRSCAACPMPHALLAGCREVALGKADRARLGDQWRAIRLQGHIPLARRPDEIDSDRFLHVHILLCLVSSPRIRSKAEAVGSSRRYMAVPVSSTSWRGTALASVPFDRKVQPTNGSAWVLLITHRALQVRHSCSHNRISRCAEYRRRETAEIVYSAGWPDAQRGSCNSPAHSAHNGCNMARAPADSKGGAAGAGILPVPPRKPCGHTHRPVEHAQQLAPGLHGRGPTAVDVPLEQEAHFGGSMQSTPVAAARYFRKSTRRKLPPAQPGKLPCPRAPLQRRPGSPDGACHGSPPAASSDPRAWRGRADASLVCRSQCTSNNMKPRPAQPCASAKPAVKRAGLRPETASQRRQCVPISHRLVQYLTVARIADNYDALLPWNIKPVFGKARLIHDAPRSTHMCSTR